MLKGNKGLTRDRGSLSCLFPCLEQGCKPAEVQGTMLPDDSDKSPWTLPYQHTSGWSPTTCMASSHTTLILLDDEVLAGCEDVIAVLMGRELEKKNWVCSKGEGIDSKGEGIDSKAGTEGRPQCPGRVGGQRHCSEGRRGARTHIGHQRADQQGIVGCSQVRVSTFAKKGPVHNEC